MIPTLLVLMIWGYLLLGQNSQRIIIYAERWVWVLHGGAEQLLRGRDQVARHWVPSREANHLWRRGGSSPVCEADLPKYSHPLRGAETTTNLVSVVIYLLFYLWRCWLSNSVKPIKWDQSRSMTKANIHFQNFDWNRFVLLPKNIQITKIGERKMKICLLLCMASYKNVNWGCWEVSSIEDQWKTTRIEG